jgi:peptide/nickel transport system substrate-binding protein
MGPHDDSNHIFNALNSHRTLSRRNFVRLLGVGAVIPVAGTLLAACEADDGDVVDVDDDAEPAATDDSDEVADEPDDEPTETDDEVEEEPDEETPEDDVSEEADSDRYGGELRVALVGEPPTFDIHLTTATLGTHMLMHIYEPLFTWDEDFQVVPDLVDTHEVSDDGLLNTVHLRQGIPFHNGNELSSADVIASVERWSELVGFGQELMNHVEEIREVDDHTIEFEMTDPFGTFPVLLARQNNGCAIYPQEVVEAAGGDAIEDYIGTGPYRFVEHQVDSHVLVERFEDYAGRDDEPSGYAGRKEAYIDQIRFIPAPDEASRIAGLQAGDFDFLENLSTDQFETLDADENVVAEITEPTGNMLLIFNMENGIMSDLTMRRAVQAVTNSDEMMTAAAGEGYYRLSPSHMMEETVWHSDAGEELYDMRDPDLAQEYLDEAGYDGEPVRILTNTEYQDMHNTALILQQQLEDIGINVEMQVFDFATFLEVLGERQEWDISIMSFAFRVDPVQNPMMRCEWGGAWCSDEKNELVDRLYAEVEFEDRYEAWEQIQQLMYEEVAGVKVADSVSLIARSTRLQNLGLVQLAPAYWNAYLSDES